MSATKQLLPHGQTCAATHVEPFEQSSLPQHLPAMGALHTPICMFGHEPP